MGGSAAHPPLFLDISDKQGFSVFKMLQLLVADARADDRAIELADVEAPARTASEHEAFLPVAHHAVEELVAEHPLRRLVVLADAAPADLSFVDLAVVLALRDDEHLLADALCIKVPCNDEGIRRMGFREAELLTTVFRDVAKRLLDPDVREQRTEARDEGLAHNAHERHKISWRGNSEACLGAERHILLSPKKPILYCVGQSCISSLGHKIGIRCPRTWFRWTGLP